MVDRLTRLDLVAISLSLLCLVHCLITPFVILAWPFVGLGNRDTFHLVMAFALLVVAMIAFIRGYQIHRHMEVLLLGGVGLTLLFLALFLSEKPRSFILSDDACVTVLGSFTLIWAHFMNLHGHRPHVLVKNSNSTKSGK